jgi:SAM-dependent methyltransferase
MPSPLIGTIALVALTGIALTVWLLRAFPLRFTVAEMGGFTWRGLAISSVFGLYLELLLIRWISSEIRIFAYFKNFVLIACFLGFGLGCYLCRRAISVAMLVAPLLFMTALIALPWAPLRRVVALLPVLLGATSEVQIWGVGSSALTPGAFEGLLLAAIVTMPLFALIALTFVPVGQLVGYYLESTRSGIAAYTVNVLASMAGIGLYTALCFADQPPAVWFLIALIIAVALLWPLRVPRLVAGAAVALCAGLIAWGASTESGTTYWSPYQKLNLRPLRVSGEVVGYELLTNSSWFQKIIDLSPQFVRAHPQLFRRIPIGLNGFNIPYRFAPHPRNVLVLGSGMGNDVAAALRNGAEHVTAVDIDPLIIRLGTQLHPEHPYSSPRVTVVNDDARAFIRNSDQRFDVIVFSALDSHTTSSHFSNIRIDNYVYTVDALEAAKRLLTPDGIYVLRFQVQRPWIAGRLHDMMSAVFHYEPLHMQAEADVYATGGNFFIAGSADKIRRALAADPQLAIYVGSHTQLRIEHVTLATDDWPYLYQREPGLPTSVVTISVLLLLVCFGAAQGVGLHLRDMHTEFFFLGAAFLLLEAQIISRMALLFGTTWIVNSIVIAVLLLLIVAANGVVAAFPRFPLDAAYAGILITIAVCWLMPLNTIFFRSFALRATVGTLLLCSPVFFAGIVFIKRFAACGFVAEAIGSNLLGALAGGILESASLWLGLRALLAIAFGLYLTAWLASRRAIRLRSSSADASSSAAAPSSAAPAQP